MDANAVINELLYKGLIPAGDYNKLTETDCPKQQNEHLHACLLKTCTKEALMRVFDIITSLQGNPKMSALGEDMQRRLESGVCVVCVCVCVVVVAMPHTCTLTPCKGYIFHNGSVVDCGGWGCGGVDVSGIILASVVPVF